MERLQNYIKEQMLTTGLQCNGPSLLLDVAICLSTLMWGWDDQQYYHDTKTVLLWFGFDKLNAHFQSYVIQYTNIRYDRRLWFIGFK